MSEVNHTPGPWKVWPEVKGSHPDHLVYISIGSVNGGRIASTGVYGHRKGRRPDATPIVSEEECRANARLIAAAPDLLAAARSALLFAEHELELRRPSGDPEYIGYAERAVTELRAAISRATKPQE
jgi:hypothetical protein